MAYYEPWMDELSPEEKAIAIKEHRSPEEIKAAGKKEQEEYERGQAGMAKDWEKDASKARRIDKYTERILYRKGQKISYVTEDRTLYKKTCPTCGEVFFTYDKRKIYDSYRCRVIGSNATQKQKHISARTNLTCEQCGKKFTAARAGAKYCCNACRQKAYRNRDK